MAGGGVGGGEVFPGGGGRVQWLVALRLELIQAISLVPAAADLMHYYLRVLYYYLRALVPRVTIYVVSVPIRDRCHPVGRDIERTFR